MAARLTDRQKKKILADYVQTNNYCATAKINGVSATTVKNLVRANADIVEKCEQKKGSKHRRCDGVHERPQRPCVLVHRQGA